MLAFMSNEKYKKYSPYIYGIQLKSVSKYIYKWK